MIPYFKIPSVSLGPFALEPFGVFAALGIYLGARLTSGRAAREGLDPRPLLDWAIWGVVSGIVFGHLVHLFLYHPEELRDTGKIFRVWDGLSSFGGLLGGLLSAVVYFRMKKLSIMAYGDAFALGLAPGWSVARLGCFSVHDHPGVKTDFPLAVAFPGGARHDLGLYDAIALALMAVVLWTLHRRGVLKGKLLAVLALMYGVSRFFLDFLRAHDMSYVDARYFGLTPGQYFCFGLVGWAIYILARGERPAQARPSEPAPGPPPGAREGG